MEQKSARRLLVEVQPEDVRSVSRSMFEELGARFQIATGVDTPDGIELLYHWALDRSACIVTVRTRVGREDPQIDSIAQVCVAAEWIEREIWELLGVRFRGHPDPRHLLLDDDWPEGKYPLRRDYER
jgi:Ni,Fe-hydrogenase III component G